MDEKLNGMIGIYSVLANQLGDCPNIEVKTAGGLLFWKTVEEKNGLRLQYNGMMGQARILDSDNIRKAWGNFEVMKEKFKRLSREEFLEPGDIVGVTRRRALSLYDHYAVYTGDGRVIHYAGLFGDFGDEVVIHEADFSEFLKDDKEFFVLHFQSPHNPPKKIQSATQFLGGDDVLGNTLDMGRCRYEAIYSPEETVERAKLRIGERQYNLVTNNCEHFALWCKTGVSESRQVKQKVNMLMTAGTLEDMDRSNELIG